MRIGDIEITILRKQIKRMYLRVHDDGRVVVSAPTFVPDSEIRMFIESRKDWISENLTAIEKKQLASSMTDLYSQDEFEKIMLEYVSEWEKKLSVRVRKITFREMSSRWGSCTPDLQTVRFNLRLMTKPRECLSYIVLHELAHIIERGHNDRFYSILTHFMPDWAVWRTLLKQ